MTMSDGAVGWIYSVEKEENEKKKKKKVKLDEVAKYEEAEFLFASYFSEQICGFSVWIFDYNLAMLVVRQQRKGGY